MNKEYRVYYISGGGTEYEDGVWTIHKTPKRIIAEKIKEYGVGVYAMHKVGEKINVGAGSGSPIKDEDDDGSFTVYFRQAGLQYIFEPIK